MTSPMETDRDPGLDPTKPLEPDRSVGELVGRLSEDVGELITTQFALAKAELRHDMAEARKAATLLGAGVAAAVLTVLMLSFAAAWGLAETLDAGWAFLIVGVVYAIAAAVLLQQGRERLKETTPIGGQTVESIKEDVEWARHQTS
jgi:uncharacterized membrane protein YqjE